MKNITRMIQCAIAATGEPVSLLIERIPSSKFHEDGISVALVNVSNNETISHPNNWDRALAMEGTCLETALEALDDLCAEVLN